MLNFSCPKILGISPPRSLHKIYIQKTCLCACILTWLIPNIQVQIVDSKHIVTFAHVYCASCLTDVISLFWTCWFWAKPQTWSRWVATRRNRCARTGREYRGMPRYAYVAFYVRACSHHVHVDWLWMMELYFVRAYVYVQVLERIHSFTHPLECLYACVNIHVSSTRVYYA